MESIQPCDEALLSRLDTHLRSQGYSQSTIYQDVFEARRFLKYLADRNIAIEAVKPVDVSQYLRCELRRHGRRHGHPPRSRAHWRSLHASCVHMLLRVINGRWPPIPVRATPREVFQQQIRHEYAQWLFTVRGLAPVSIDQLSREAGRFIAWLGERCDPERMPQLTGEAIEAYLTFRAPSLCRRSQQSKAQVLSLTVSCDSPA